MLTLTQLKSKSGQSHFATQPSAARDHPHGELLTKLHQIQMPHLSTGAWAETGGLQITWPLLKHGSAS